MIRGLGRRWPLIAYAIVALAFLILRLKVTGVFVFKHDAATYAHAAKMLEARDWAGLYGPIPGSAFFAYAAPAAAYFWALKLVFGNLGFFVHLFLNIFLPSLALGAFVKRFNLSPSAALFAVACFFYPLWESLYLGQVDLTLLAALLGYFLFYEQGKRWLAATCLVFVVTFKPQFGLFLILPLFAKDWRFFMNAAVLGISGLALFALVFGVGFEEAKFLVNIYQQSIETIVIQPHSPTNQSLRGVLSMIFSETPFNGWYCPERYAPTRQLDGIFPLSAAIVSWFYRSLTLLMSLAFLVVAFWLHRNRSFNRVFVLCLLILPTLSPVFWQAHMVYLLPAFVFLAARSQSPLMPFALLAIPLMSPAFLGNCYYDLFMARGAYYLISLVGLGLLLNMDRAKPPFLIGSYSRSFCLQLFLRLFMNNKEIR